MLTATSDPHHGIVAGNRLRGMAARNQLTARVVWDCMFQRLPSRRAIAASMKFLGYRIERRWPFVFRADGKALNLNFEEILEFQYARRRRFYVMTVGAFDGIQNDPLARFARTHRARGILLEPQPGAFVRLKNNHESSPDIVLLNAAIDEHSGSRVMYYVDSPPDRFPSWTEQVASFDYDHVAKHESQVPGLTKSIRELLVPTISFRDLLERYSVVAIDVLLIDAEGFDAKILSWFPFDRIRPGVIHYEAVHIEPVQLQALRARLQERGYVIVTSDPSNDDVAVRLGRLTRWLRRFSKVDQTPLVMS